MRQKKEHSERTTCYNTDDITTFMQSVYADYVDGYNCLDTEGLLQAAMKELQATHDTNTPVEFQIACNKIATLHQESSRNA